MNIDTNISRWTARPQAAPSAPKDQVAPPTSTGPGLFDGLVDAGYFAMNEIVEVGKNDPALALRYGATTLSEQLLTGVADPVRQGFGAAIIPTIRLSILAANGYRTRRTFMDPTSHWAEKAFDVARVATDTIGLAGSVMKYVWPTKAALGDTLVGASYAADAVSHSVRAMTHGADRVNIWKKKLEERRENNRRKIDEVVQPPAPTTIAMLPGQAATGWHA